MAIIIQGINSPVVTDSSEIIGAALKKAGIKKAVQTGIHKISLDARKQNDIKTVSSVWAELESRAEEEKICSLKDFCTYVDITPFEPKITGSISPEGRIAVCGFGPAGMFAALVLAEMGYRPLVLERGADVDNRSRAVSDFWHGGEFSPETNVQFGEGGAGTFSDGKLTTRIKDPLCRYVSARFAEFGAPDEILTKAKPHIGTDVLRQVGASMRREILSLGGEVRFESQLWALRHDGCQLTGITVMTEQGGTYDMDCDALILAPGHSARDTFAMLRDAGVPMEKKNFAIGVRIEHLQEAISRRQYGPAFDRLPPSDYKLACHLPNGRSAFTFCVCPGGQVVAAASDYGQAVTNGMSLRARDGKNINGGFLVGVGPEDFPGDDPLAGVRFQEQWERAAWLRGGESFRAPAQLVGDFLARQPSAGPGEVAPTYRPGVTWGALDGVLPNHVTDTLRGAIPLFDRKLRGFARPDGVLTGVETRSSSPLRILRDGSGRSALRGLYPCGEGAGYAGGIVSAAVDGVRIAEAVALG